jgi:hypothetical protein
VRKDRGKVKRTLFVLLVGLAMAAALLVSTASAFPQGRYTLIFKCGSTLTSAKVTRIDFTQNGSVVQTVVSPNFQCKTGQDGAVVTVNAEFNDLTVAYVCPSVGPGTPTPTPGPVEGQLDIAAGQLELNKAYPLKCPSTASTPTPGPFPTPGSGDGTIMVSNSVGGIDEAPDASALAATSSGGSSGGTYALAGIAAAAVVVILGAGGWYARRRWLE